MSTPIEIVRHYVGSQQFVDEMFMVSDAGRDKLHTALASVLRDAERFAALELENDTNQKDDHRRWCFWHKNLGYHIHEAKLAELADRLRKETK